MDIKKILSGKIFYKRQQIFFDDYLKDIIENIEKFISNEDEKIKPKLILTLEKEKIEFIMLSIIGIIKFYNILTDNSRSMLDEIKIGDIVVYKSNKYIYLGYSKIINGEQKIKLKARNSKQQGVNCESIEYINKNSCNELSLYYGESDKLSFIRKQTNTFENYKKLFEKMLNISSDFTNGIINDQIIVVFESKKYMEQLLTNYFIKIDDIKYGFTDIFPCKYYTDENKHVNFKNDITKGLFLFTSKLELANEMLINNMNNKNLIILGENTYRNKIETTLHRLFRRLEKNKLKNIIIYNNYNQINDIEKLLEHNIDVYSWNKTVLYYKCQNKEQYINSYNIIHKIFNYNVQFELMKNDEINKLFIELYKGLTILLKTNEEIYDKTSFLIICFKIFNQLQNYVYPIKVYKANNIISDEENKEDLILKNILKKNEDYIINYNFLNPIIINLKNLKNVLYDKNPKIRILKKIVTEDSIIVCDNEEEKQLLKKENKLNYKKIITKEEVDEECEDEKFIFLSIYKKTKKFQLAYATRNEIINILNYVQAKKYNSMVIFMKRLLDKIAIENKLQKDILSSKQYDYMSNIKLEALKNEDQSVGESEEITYDDTIEKYVEQNVEGFNYQLEMERLQNLKQSCSNNNLENFNSGICVVGKKLIFENASYAYITDNSKLILLDENNRAYSSIINCKVGDKVLFIDEKSDDDLNGLFNKIVSSKIFKETYKAHYENMIYWKNILKNYMSNYDLNYSNIISELNVYRISKTETAVRQWINSDAIVGPREEEFYKIIGKMTCDKKLENDWQKIYESNNKIRGFRTLFKKTFKNMISNSLYNNQTQSDELEILVRNVFGDLKEYARIVQIKEIQRINVEIPYVQTNCVISNRN